MGSRMLLRMLRCVVFAMAAVVVAAQGISVNDAALVRSILKNAHEVVQRNYYDPTLAGLDWTARYNEYLKKVDTAPSLNAGLGLVATFLDGLNDSHTTFQPPSWSKQVDYGYDLQVVGDTPFIVRTRPGTDAATKLTAGDQVVSVYGNAVTRENIGKLEYVLTMLNPLAAVEMVVRSQAGQDRSVVVQSKVTNGLISRNIGGPGAAFHISDLVREMEEAQHLIRHRAAEVGSVMVWKAPTFLATNAEIDSMVSKARKHSGLVLDLRGNPGGAVDALTRLVGGMFQRSIKIGTRTTRSGTSNWWAATRGTKSFSGKLIVLIDSSSGSCAEMFARVVQLEGRGVVIGDRSAGVVREARVFPFAHGMTSLVPYAISVTHADIHMNDGASLEHVGVTPDHLQLPTPSDLSAGLDPVLAYAVGLAGGTLDPMAAARLFAGK